MHKIKQCCLICGLETVLLFKKKPLDGYYKIFWKKNVMLFWSDREKNHKSCTKTCLTHSYKVDA